MPNNLVLQSRVEHLLDSGASLDRVEQMIDRLHVSEDEKDALKVWAWAWRESRPRLFRRLRAVLVPFG